MITEIQRPKVALIGRPNVGKSTLFNRLIGASGRRGGRSAIVDEMPGVTRDRLYGVCDWDGYEFTVIDCGGIGQESEDPLWEPVADNSRRAMAEADLIIFMVDARSGLTLSDENVLRELRKLKKPVVVGVNKVDSSKHELDAHEFWKLGYTDLAFVSAIAGRRTNELLDLVVKALDWSKWPQATPAFIKERIEQRERGQGLYADDEDAASAGTLGPERDLDAEPDDDEPVVATEEYPFAWNTITGDNFVPDESWKDLPVRLVFVGRQNVGKSSMINFLLGEQRALVAALPGTTRDPLFARFEYGGQNFEVLDTAGMKRISRIQQDVDYYSLIRAERGLKGSEVALLTIDAAVGITEQDKRVASKIEDEGRSIVIVVNKSDLIGLEETITDEEWIAPHGDDRDGEDGEEYDGEETGEGFSADGESYDGVKIRPLNKRRKRKVILTGTRMPNDIERSLYDDYLRKNLGKLRWAEIVYTSAILGRGMDDLLKAATRSRDNFHRRIDNRALRAVLEEAITLVPPPIVKNRELRFFDFRQIGNCPPTFLVEINDKMVMRQAYRRYIERAIRRHFDFAGTHIQLVIYQKKRHVKK